MRMKYIRMILVAAVSVVFFSAFTMKGGDKPVYVFGVGASFKDSVVYFTEVQVVDSVALKDGLLPDREQYSFQFPIIRAPSTSPSTRPSWRKRLPRCASCMKKVTPISWKVSRRPSLSSKSHNIK